MAILIAGFGNVLLGDDGFGVEVIKKLSSAALPSDVQTMDVGIGGMEMIFALKNGFNDMIVVDAVRRGEPPGTVYVFSPKGQEVDVEINESVNPHVAEPAAAMRMAKRLGILPPKVSVVGCEPESCVLGIGLSAAVKAAVSEAVTRILDLVDVSKNNRGKRPASEDFGRP